MRRSANHSRTVRPVLRLTTVVRWPRDRLTARATPYVTSTPASVCPNDASFEDRLRRTWTTCPSPLTRATSSGPRGPSDRLCVGAPHQPAGRILLASLRVLLDHRRVRLRVGLDSLQRGWGLHLARALLYLPA